MVGAADRGCLGPVMFCIHDAQRGEVSILHGTDEVIVHDRQLVARIVQAADRPPPSRRKPEGQAMSSCPSPVSASLNGDHALVVAAGTVQEDALVDSRSPVVSWPMWRV